MKGNEAKGLREVVIQSFRLSSSERPGGSSGWLQTVIYELWQVLTPCLLYRFRRRLGIAQAPWFTHLQIRYWITKSCCVRLSPRIAERNRDAQMEDTSVNLQYLVSQVFASFFLLLSCVKYPRHDGSFKTICVLCTIYAEPVNIPSIQGINYISGLS